MVHTFSRLIGHGRCIRPEPRVKKDPDAEVLYFRRFLLKKYYAGN